MEYLDILDLEGKKQVKLHQEKRCIVKDYGIKEYMYG